MHTFLPDRKRSVKPRLYGHTAPTPHSRASGFQHLPPASPRIAGSRSLPGSSDAAPMASNPRGAPSSRRASRTGASGRSPMLRANRWSRSGRCAARRLRGANGTGASIRQPRQWWRRRQCPSGPRRSRAPAPRRCDPRAALRASRSRSRETSSRHPSGHPPQARGPRRPRRGRRRRARCASRGVPTRTSPRRGPPRACSASDG